MLERAKRRAEEQLAAAALAQAAVTALQSDLKAREDDIAHLNRVILQLRTRGKALEGGAEEGEASGPGLPSGRPISRAMSSRSAAEAPVPAAAAKELRRLQAEVEVAAAELEEERARGRKARRQYEREKAGWEATAKVRAIFR